MVDRLADPLLSGVYGGEAAQAQRARRAAALRRDGGEVRQPEPRHAGCAAEDGAVAHKGPPKPLFTSLKDGMQQMVDTLISAPESRVDPHASPHSSNLSRGRRLARLYRDERRRTLRRGYSRNSGECRRRAARPVDHELARNLLGITYSSSVTVTLGYYRDQLRSCRRDSAFCVPRSEGTRMLACTFVHNKFPHRAPAEQRHPALLPRRRPR